MPCCGQRFNRPCAGAGCGKAWTGRLRLLISPRAGNGTKKGKPMRLICPSCGTEYEVEAAAIPPEGRDVQCSNCQTVWFQTAEVRDEAPPTAADRKVEAAAPSAVPEVAPEDVAPEQEALSAGAADLAAEVSFEAPPPLPQRVLDPQVLAILHQEAARETAARAAEKAVERAKAESAPPAPVAPEAVEVKAPAAKEAPKAPAKMPTKAAVKVALKAPVAKAPAASKAEAAPPTVEMAEAPDAAPRRAKARPALPDVEMVKSSLTAREAPPLAARKDGLATPYESHAPARSGRGFGRGFVLSLLLGAVLWGAYAQAPRLAQAWPPAAPYLSAYVQKVDGWRRDLASGLTRVAQTLRRSDAGL